MRVGRGKPRLKACRGAGRGDVPLHLEAVRESREGKSVGGGRAFYLPLWRQNNLHLGSEVTSEWWAGRAVVWQQRLSMGHLNRTHILF